VYAGGKEGFVAVDIAKAHDNGLIEEEGFSHSTTAQKLFEMRQTDAQRFWAQLCHCGIGQEPGFGGIQLDSAEAPHIAEVKGLLTSAEFEPKMGVPLGAATGPGPIELTGHSQVNG